MKVGTIILAYRVYGRIGIRETAKEIGISAATLSRIERGENVDGKTMVKIFSWLFQ